MQTHEIQAITALTVFLEALILPNGISALAYPSHAGIPKLNLQSRRMVVAIDEDAISGKKKKGAKLLKPSDMICEVDAESENTRIMFKTPVGGKLLEISDMFTNHVAILMLKTPTVTLDGPRDYLSLVDDVKKRKVVDETFKQ